MNLFIFWMTGSSLSIYTIMFTMQLATAPFKALSNVNQAFMPFEQKGVALMMPKLVFIACQLILACIALYKFSMMGIIPVRPIDWNGLFSASHPIEHAQVLQILPN
mmetsp:Transcript_1325/g.892  ORF Transcript_1325/g.892 Transcript_1325/m.892 type:complete len:106 (+) Transcript_1325:208-525(+)